MGNRSSKENEGILLKNLREAGEAGLTIEQARLALSDSTIMSKSLAKKVLEGLREKGAVRVKMGKSGVCYQILPGR